MAGFRKQKEAAEYAITGIPPAPTGSGLSLTKVELIDFISEGPIEGFVSGEYKYVGSPGNIGYTSYQFVDYPTLGNVNWLRSIYWNQVPVAAANPTGNGDQFNFQQVNIKFSPGLSNGSILDGIDTELTITRAISERLRAGGTLSKYYRIYNKDAKGVIVNIKVGQFSENITKVKKYGDVVTTRVDYNISYRPVFGTPSTVSSATIAPVTNQFGGLVSRFIQAKVTYGYIQSTRILFDNFNQYYGKENFLGWEVKITRDTPDSIVRTTINPTTVDSLTEIYGNVFSYPNSAIASSLFSAEFFQQVPARAYDTKLLKIKVPNNYDPIKKTYGDSRTSTTSGPQGSDFWNGEFKENREWSDNPAWCFYDLVTNKRYGLGNYIDTDSIDKWTLYDIAKYCDTLVPDGMGGVEPRFVCNAILTSQEEAIKVLNDMASIFRGMVYYNAGLIYVSQDSPQNPIVHFTNANVENGDFIYSSSSKRVRNTVAVIRYNDKNNFYQPAVEYVEDVDAIRRYGIREEDLTAFGCTSRGQALRFGRWALLVESLATETVEFVAGLEGSYLRPGDVFSVFDQNRKSKRHAGRINKIELYNTGARVTLDSTVTGFKSANKYKFGLLTPSFSYDSSLVSIENNSQISGIRRPFLQTVFFSGWQVATESGYSILNIVPNFLGNNNLLDNTNYTITGNPVWTIEATGTSLEDEEIASSEYDYFRAIGIRENEEHKYSISAVQYVPGLYDAVETGLSFEEPSRLDTPAGPISIGLTLRNITTNSKTIDYTVGFQDSDLISDFYIYAKRDSIADGDTVGSSNLIGYVSKQSPNGTFLPTENGNYYFRAHSVSPAGIRSTAYASNNITVSDIYPIRDVIIHSLNVETGEDFNNPGTIYDAISTEVEPEFIWAATFQNGLNFPSDFKYNVSVRSHNNGSNIPSNTIFYSGTGFRPDNSLNPDFAFTTELNTGYLREYDFVVYAVDSQGNCSAGGNFITDRFGDSTFENPNGYDILHVTNPAITNITLIDEDEACTVGGYCTEQWINSEGEVKILLKSGFNMPDLAGAVVYYGQSAFTATDVLNGTVPYKIIPSSGGDTIIANARILSSTSAYVALSLYDSFDERRSQAQTNWLATGLDVSNVLLINKRGGFDEQGQLFRSWIHIKINKNESIIDFTGEGISQVVTTPFVQNNNDFQYEIYFDTPLASTNYVLLGFKDRDFGAVRPTYKYIDRVVFSGDTQNEIIIADNGVYTFGILHA